MIPMTHSSVCLPYCALRLAKSSNSLYVLYVLAPLCWVLTVPQRGKICKPYNSVLGEHFRAHWDIIPVSYPADPADPPVQHLYVALPASSSSKSDTVSVKSFQSSHPNIAENTGDNSRNGDTLSMKSANSGLNNKIGNSSPTSALSAAVGETILAAGMSNLSLAGSAYNAETGELIEGEVEGGERVRVIYLVSSISRWYIR